MDHEFNQGTDSPLLPDTSKSDPKILVGEIDRLRAELSRLQRELADRDRMLGDAKQGWKEGISSLEAEVERLKAVVREAYGFAQIVERTHCANASGIKERLLDALRESPEPAPEPITIDQLEDKLRAMGWTDEQLKSFAGTFAELLRSTGVDAVPKFTEPEE